MTVAATRALAPICAGVTVKAIAVVAGLMTRLPFGDVLTRDAVATARDHARIEAGVRRRLVTVVTLLAPFPDKVIAAASDLAGAGAGVGVDLIAVIAGFVAVDLPVTARFAAAVGVAAVAPLTVAIITAFPRRAVSVTTDRDRAAVRAGVHIVGVAVVALFSALYEAVTADRTTAQNGALVVARCVPVITLFITLNDPIAALRCATIDALPGASILSAFTGIAGFPWLDDPITAARQRAGVRAGVVVDGVSVVTGFTLLNKAVPADRVAAERRAGCGGAVGVAEVALLVALDDAVTALSRTADVRAAVRIHRVPVVATFPRLNEAVAAIGQRATARAAVVVAGVAVITALAALNERITADRGCWCRRLAQ